MRNLKEIDSRVMWIKHPLNRLGIKSATMTMPSGVQAHLVIGENEDGWEHVSIELMARRLPTWEEMCLIKDIFWNEEEEVVQIHPRHSEYVNMCEALHLWRPCNGDWSIMNDNK